MQVVCIALYKHVRRAAKHSYPVFDLKHFKHNFMESVKNQHRNIYKTSQTIKRGSSITPASVKEFIQSESIMHLVKGIILLSIILNVAGVTWYIAMSLAPASDITAIYNCSAFTALLFAIPILHEKFTYVKLFSVLIAVIGVFCVAYSGESRSDDSEFPQRILGDLIIAFGAVMYGLYEVLYKKLSCPPVDAVSSRRLVAFSNFCASVIGLATFSFGWFIILVAHVMGWSRFTFITSLYTWLIIVFSIVSNLVFSLSFLALMSLTSPVLSSVSSLITILFVGLFEWILFGISISAGQLVGDFFVVIGFIVLSYSYWNEITEEDVDDDDAIDPTDVEA
jgi:drug/metabolite transporter (DMT)-like permease